MSQVLPIPVREPVKIAPRKMTKARRRRILERDDWTCCVNGCPKFYGWPLEVDHRIPLALGGSDDDDNLITICRIHHLAKTALGDVPAIAKAKRLSGETGHGYKRGIAGRVDPWPPKGSRKLRGRGVR